MAHRTESAFFPGLEAQYHSSQSSQGAVGTCTTLLMLLVYDSEYCQAWCYTQAPGEYVATIQHEQLHMIQHDQIPCLEACLVSEAP